MQLIPRRKSRPTQAAEVVITALKLGAIYEAAKGAGKTARKALKGTAAYKAGKAAAKRTPVVRRLPVVLAAGGVGVLTVRKLRSGDEPQQPTQTTPPPPTSATVPG